MTLIVITVGTGHLGGIVSLLLLLVGSLLVWYRPLWTVSVASIRTCRAEVSYWVTCSHRR